MPLHGGHLLLPGCQHLVEGVSADGRPAGVKVSVRIGVRDGGSESEVRITCSVKK